MEFATEYNYNIDRIREKEFPGLKGVTYVDYTGTAIYAVSQIEAFKNDLFTNLYGNPHSRNSSSQLSTDTIDQVRYRVLNFFNASSDEYTVVFTSGCTGALKLVADSFAFEQADQEDHSTEEAYRRKPQDETTSKGNADPKKENIDSKMSDLGKTEKKSPGFACFLMDNHTSVYGMRELVVERASVLMWLNESDLFESPTRYTEQIKSTSSISNHLFSYPAESNYSGRKYPLDWIEKIHQQQMPFQKGCQGRWFVLLDAAAFLPTSRLDLDKYKPDFVALSFYKIFGFPTGLGALIVKNDSAVILHKHYFGGGTVVVSDISERFHVFRPNISDRFEDGSLSFLDIVALRHGFDTFNRIGGGIAKISRHTFAIARYFHHNLVKLSHGNGTLMAKIYADTDFEDITTQGAIVNFNLFRANGECIGFFEINKLAVLENIHFRSGCFCNIGSCRKFLNLTSKHLREHYAAGHDCGDSIDVMDGMHIGSMRFSFGYTSTLRDVQICLQFIVDYFMEAADKPNFLVDYMKADSNCQPPDNSPSANKDNDKQSSDDKQLGDDKQFGDDKQSSGSKQFGGDKQFGDAKQFGDEKQFCDGKEMGHNFKEVMTYAASDSVSKSVIARCSDDTRFITNICLFPIKSCAAFQVSKWEIGARGFKYDRMWMITRDSGISLGQKREPKLCFIQPSIDLERGLLILNYPGMSRHEVALSLPESELETEEMKLCTNKVCADRVTTVDCGDSVAAWISKALQTPGCRLLQQKDDDNRKSKSKEESDSALSLANVSQYLLISRSTVKALKEKLESSEVGDIPDEDNLVSRFRGNLVIGGGKAFEEESWDGVLFGSTKLLCQGQCYRCQMVCFDPVTGERTKEPLRTLASWRGGKVPFGVYLSMDSSGQSGQRFLQVGDTVQPIQPQTT